MTQPKPCARNFLCPSFHYSQDSYVLSQFAVVEHSQCSKEFMSPSLKEGEREGEAEEGEVKGGEGKQQQDTSITTQILWGLMIDNTCINHQYLLINLLTAKSLFSQ